MEQDNEYTEFVKGLIDAVREEPCIYDKKHSFYFNKFEKEKSWYKIAEQLGRSVEDCQKRWKLLRERLAKELKKRERAFANDQTFQSEWSCFEKIVFIEDHIVRRRRHHPYSSLPNDFHDKLVHTLSDSNQSSASSSFTNNIYHNWQKLQFRRTDQVLQKHCEKQTSAEIARQRNISPTSSISDQSASNNCKNNSEKSNNVNGITRNARFDATTVHRGIKNEPDEMIDLDSESDDHDAIYESEDIAVNDGAVMNSQSSICKVLPRNATTYQSIHRYQDHDQSVTLPTSTTIVEENEAKTSSAVKKAAQGASSSNGGVEDSDVLFGKMVTAMLKEIPHEVHKDNAKIYIMQMLIKAKCENN